MGVTKTTTCNTLEAARRAGLSYRRTDFLVRTGILDPMVKACGSGTARAWSDEDVALLAIAARVMRAVGSGYRPIVERIVDQLRPLPLAWWPEDLTVDLDDGVTISVHTPSYLRAV